MMRDVPIEQLLRWRLAVAESDAGAAPPGRRLLALARPWWETWPERFRAQAERVGRVPVGYGFAMTGPRRERRGEPVPALVVRAEETEARALFEYFSVREGRLRARFRLDGVPGAPERELEATFVGESTLRPLFAARAELSQSGEYRVEAELPVELEAEWAALRVTDRMPFRLILRVADDPGRATER